MVKVNNNLTTTLVFGATLAVSSYVIVVDILRRREIRRRRQKKRRATLKETGESEVTPQEHYAALNVLGRFVNPFEEHREQGAWEWSLWKIQSLLTLRVLNSADLPLDWLHWRVDERKLDSVIPIHCPDLKLLFPNSTNDKQLSESWATLDSNETAGKERVTNQMTVTWLGQSTAFVQIGALNILTDPIFSEYIASRFTGQKRFRKCPLTIKQLERIDIVLLSHNHYDHLDEASAREIGNSAMWYIPMGLKSWFGRRGINRVTELSWWDKVPIPGFPGFEVAAAPAMHWSARHPFDTNRSLWCSLLIICDGHHVLYHVGDTGYVKDLFKDIQRVYGKPELALM